MSSNEEEYFEIEKWLRLLSHSDRGPKWARLRSAYQWGYRIDFDDANNMLYAYNYPKSFIREFRRWSRLNAWQEVDPSKEPLGLREWCRRNGSLAFGPQA